MFGNDLAPWPAQLRSFELISEFVKPHFAGANRARRASYAWAKENIAESRQKAAAAVAAATQKFEAGGR